MIKNCPMRHENGNCIPAGGFCTANKNICEALHNAYRMGKAQLSSKSTTSDLISRQAVLDAIVQCTNCGDEDTLREYVLKHSLDNGWTGGILEALDAVKDLPPAQPEVLACGNGELVAKPEPKWIPCSERMPKTGVEVLTYDEALNYIEIQTFSDGRWENQRGDWQDPDDIAAWMPLPKPFEGGTE